MNGDVSQRSLRASHVMTLMWYQKLSVSNGHFFEFVEKLLLWFLNIEILLPVFPHEHFFFPRQIPYVN